MLPAFVVIVPPTLGLIAELVPVPDIVKESMFAVLLMAPVVTVPPAEALKDKVVNAAVVPPPTAPSVTSELSPAAVKDKVFSTLASKMIP